MDVNKIQNICDKYKIKCKIYSDIFYIETDLNTWICEDKDTHFRLKHKNKGVCKHMCHMHNRKFNNINEVIEYIHTHDSKTVFDRRRTHERRLDKLLNEISIHNQQKQINNKSIPI